MQTGTWHNYVYSTVLFRAYHTFTTVTYMRRRPADTFSSDRVAKRTAAWFVMTGGRVIARTTASQPYPAGNENVARRGWSYTASAAVSSGRRRDGVHPRRASSPEGDRRAKHDVVSAACARVRTACNRRDRVRAPTRLDVTSANRADRFPGADSDGRDVTTS